MKKTKNEITLIREALKSLSDYVTELENKVSELSAENNLYKCALAMNDKTDAEIVNTYMPAGRPRCKINIVDIIECKKNNMSENEIAARYNCSISTIKRVKKKAENITL